MPLWTLILWLIIGGIAGIAAGKVMKSDPPYGLIGDVLLGIAGAVVGGWVLGLLGFSGGGGIIGSLIVAFIGAVILIWVARFIKKST